MPAWTWPSSRIVRVVDGDTVDALLVRDVGFGGSLSFITRLRLNRINAAPAHTPAGQSATLLVQTWILRGLVTIVTEKPYKFGGPDTSPGEWMAEVTDSNGANLSDALATAGLAVYWDGNGPRPGG